jgi:hypothetical protein
MVAAFEKGLRSRKYITDVYYDNFACSTDVGSLREGIIKRPKVYNRRLL